MPAAVAASREAVAIRLAAREARQQVDAGKAVEGLGDGDALGHRRTDRRCGRGSVNCVGPGRLRGERQDCRAVLHQALVGLVGAIPLQHGEFRMVQRAALAVAEDAGEFEDPRLARRQQLLAGEFRRGAQIERRVRRRPAPTSSVAKACRWASLPGETCSAGVSTSTKSRAANQPRSAAMMRLRASRNGRRSAWTSGAHQGEACRPSVDSCPRARRKSLAVGLRIGMLRPEMHEAVAGRPSQGIQSRESHRQLAPQRQRRRHGRQALRRRSPPRTSTPARARP